MKPQPKYSEWLFKCCWQSTATTYKVPGKNYEDAWKRMHAILKRTEGGEFVWEIKCLKQVS